MADGQVDTREGGAGTANQCRPPSVVFRIRSDRQPCAAHGGTASSQPVDAEMKLTEIGLSADRADGTTGAVQAARLPNPHATQRMTTLRVRA